MVYRDGAEAAVNGGPLYRFDGRPGLPFIYPPFAAFAFTFLLAFPAWLGAMIFNAISFASLAVISYLCAARWTALSGTLSGWKPWQIAAPILALAATSEVATENFYHGQVNIIIAAIVLSDLLSNNRFRGFATGIAAGIKISPLLFVGLMIVRRQWGDAMRACVGFLLTVLIGLGLGLDRVIHYWTSEMFQMWQLVNGARTSNASLKGIFAREVGGRTGDLLWLSVSVLLIGAAIWLAYLWWSSSRLAALSIVGLASTLVSPIAWIHHWVWMIPMGVVLLALAIRSFRINKALSFALYAGVILLLIPPLTHLRRLWPKAVQSHWPNGSPITFNQVISLGYGTVSLLSIVVLAWALVLRSRVASDRGGLTARPPGDSEQNDVSVADAEAPSVSA